MEIRVCFGIRPEKDRLSLFLEQLVQIGQGFGA